MKRRSLLATALVFLLSMRAAWSQAAAKRVAVLTAGGPSAVPAALRDAMRNGLHNAGLGEGRAALEWRYGEVDRLRDLATDLVRTKPDLIVAINTPAALAAKRATNSIPILFLRVADPVAAGLAASLARPGGNATGFVPFTPELGGKRLAILKDALPGISRVAVLYMSTNAGAALTFRQIAAAGTKLGVSVLDAGVRAPADLGAAIENAAREKAGALMLVDDVVLGSNMAAIVERSLRERLPLSSIYRDFAESGALVAYGPNPDEMYAGAADYAVRILRGARPGELPVQQPARFELVVNLKSAASLGLTLPASFLANADTVLR